MTFCKLKHYLLISVLLLNQWFAASVMACAMPEQLQIQPVVNKVADALPCHDMDMSSDMNNAAVSEGSPTGTAMDCCDDNCHCTISICSSAVLVNVSSQPLISHNKALVSYHFSSQTSALKQQQKPPQSV